MPVQLICRVVRYPLFVYCTAHFRRLPQKLSNTHTHTHTQKKGLQILIALRRQTFTRNAGLAIF
ncbi:hypothetical protein BGW36DRAFT_367826 [Talaromyces proteolyticus]|uniref:Uncharacterized protein n=1 Tax=Talaromyces proteolyticus TaxID=1131652 RepID=A0AAD4L7Z7_9EURO|nr:uncharacterized protein BGW36DRAFT_367826 [Talaromyces proteolyticus]KAH8705574.1 hypothetical protein BGW36DRAFT_367826 [Talaromyces proteolyticus]